jgi:uncharacterized protein YifE (UPF0438 family)
MRQYKNVKKRFQSTSGAPVKRLSEAEIALLREYLDLACAIEAGTREPRTDVQKHFLQVCRGEAEPATKYERAFLKWRSLGRLQLIVAPMPENEKTKTSSKNTTQKNSQKQEFKIRKALENAKRHAQLTEADAASKHKKFVQEPTRIILEWGTREDFKKDAASWKRLSKD